MDQGKKIWIRVRRSESGYEDLDQGKKIWIRVRRSGTG
jgi:hypothetical protein